MKNMPYQLCNLGRVEGTHGGADPVICNDFLDMILNGKEPVATPIAGRMSVAAGCAAAESLRSGGKVVEVPPVFLTGTP